MTVVNASVGSGPIIFNGTGTFSLYEIENLTIDTGLKESIQYASGQVDPSYTAVMTSQPMVTFTTKELNTAIAGGITYDPPLAITTGGAGITSADIYWIGMAQKGTRTTGGTQFKCSILNGMVIPKSVKCSQGQPATMDCEIRTVYDGTNNPLTFATAATLASTPVFGQLFTLGPVEINGTTINGVQSTTVDFGFDLVNLASSGDVFDTFIAVKTRNPKITFTTTEVVELNTLGLTGTAQGVAANTVVYFQKLTEFGTRVAAATAAHIKLNLSASQGFIYATNLSGNNNDTAIATVTISPVVGTSAILTVSGASAIT